MRNHIAHFRLFQQIAMLFFIALFSYGQEDVDENVQTEESRNFKFSGSININTNGISPVPAFSLDKPSIIGTFSLEKRRLKFNPEIAFSTKMKPWFINPRFTYNVIDREKFGFDISTLFSFSYSYPEELINNNLETSTKIEHYALLQSTSLYTLSKKTSISLTTFHGFGLKSASIKRGNFFVLGGSIAKQKISEKLYHSLFPQLTYINLDGEDEGLFASCTFGVGHNDWPFFLSTQLTQALATNISPNPGFKWNVGLSYNF